MAPMHEDISTLTMDEEITSAEDAACTTNMRTYINYSIQSTYHMSQNVFVRRISRIAFKTGARNLRIKFCARDYNSLTNTGFYGNSGSL